MKVTLIALEEDLNCYGLRCLSSVLRERGVSTQVVFFGKASRSRGGTSVWSADALDYAPQALEDLAALCADSDLVGFSVMTLYFSEAVRVTRFLKARIRAPIVWGGIHPTTLSEESLRYADLVCLGEAEETILEAVDRLSQGRELDGVPGLWFKRYGKIVTNPIRLPPKELDRLPHPDNSLDGHFVHHADRVVPLTGELFLGRLGRHYMTINARGCPLRCTYCSNARLGNVFKWTTVRCKSVGKIISEIREVVSAYPEITGVKLSDDAFGDLPLEYIRELGRAYKREVGLPLGIPGFSPMNLTEDKLTALIDGDLVYLRTDDDVTETIRLLLQLPKPYALAVFSLTFLPGPPLYTKARREGLLTDEKGMVYRSSPTLRQNTQRSLRRPGIGGRPSTGA